MTAERDKATGQFQAGQSGNPNGRPRGARNRLNEQFLQDFYGAWQEHGIAALRRTAIEEPAAFVRVAASLLPHRQPTAKHTEH
jgi:hypothetical protein